MHGAMASAWIKLNWFDWELLGLIDAGNRLYTSVSDIIPDGKVYGPTWGPSGADRTQVGPMLAAWTLLYGMVMPAYFTKISKQPCKDKNLYIYMYFITFLWTVLRWFILVNIHISFSNGFLHNIHALWLPVTYFLYNIFNSTLCNSDIIYALCSSSFACLTLNKCLLTGLWQHVTK